MLNARVLRYRRERWLTPQDETTVALLPGGISGHFGPELRRFGQCRVVINEGHIQFRCMPGDRFGSDAEKRYATR